MKNLKEGEENKLSQTLKYALIIVSSGVVFSGVTVLLNWMKFNHKFHKNKRVIRKERSKKSVEV